MEVLSAFVFDFLGLFWFNLVFVLENLLAPWKNEQNISPKSPFRGLALGHLDTDFRLPFFKDSSEGH